ncbi:3-deoxy-manno-octulosonate cytidylyltransferase [Hymenobacter cellulosivorans]|uniref:3-deoxy-manno-octulosonate cytidylyltransferase n=1 Tax=Hymenobacter cellulosivorans TaxID=2932249 RepID=A0ABY4FG82_9BACT|nr:3-deoxy-manno-octulosonate cytidylyltransferase [Hymenobacter cellulosivorans]UOQ55704.1 3-deoxy-manno-octulosonate cytidylyltransferase [Hymenobacter cellulosivorans]
MNAIGIIPARYASTRLPGKPLVDLGNKSMIQRVVEQARLSRLSRVVVATDDERILDHVRSFGGEAVLTSADHPSGTDRVFEAYCQLDTPADCIINIQGDEPFIQPGQINALIDLFVQAPSTQLATLVKPVETNEELFSPHMPKVVLNGRGQALYFSRHPLPYQRQYPQEQWLDQHRYLRHIGLYAYRADILAEITRLPPSTLELAESLEQLRWLEHGYQIQTAETTVATLGIDTPDDVERARQQLDGSGH